MNFVTENWVPSQISIYELFRALIMVLEIAMIEPKTQVGGVHVVLDMKGLSLNHIIQFTPSFAKNMLSFVQVGFVLNKKLNLIHN